MTPKEKAEELVKKMYKVHSDSVSGITMFFAKQCALIAVDEALNVFIQLHNKLVLMDVVHGTVESTATYIFWQEVKQEIEKL